MTSRQLADYVNARFDRLEPTKEASKGRWAALASRSYEGSLPIDEFLNGIIGQCSSTVAALELQYPTQMGFPFNSYRGLWGKPWTFRANGSRSFTINSPLFSGLSRGVWWIPFLEDIEPPLDTSSRETVDLDEIAAAPAAISFSGGVLHFDQ